MIVPQSSSPIQPYYKKTVTLSHDSFDFQFKVSQELFSSLEIDHGTQRLLRTMLFEKVDSYSKVLDLGCGYGPIGIVLKKMRPSAEVHLVDTDALALEFAKENALLNATEPVKIYPSLGYDQVKDTDFDLIVSNIPAKIGEKALEHMLKDARAHLVPNGKVIVVVIDEISEYVKKSLEKDETIIISYHKNWPGHHVFHYSFVQNQAGDEPQTSELNQLNISRKTHHSAFQNKVYFRPEPHIPVFNGNNCPFEVSYSLAEFDQFSFETQLLVELLEDMKQAKPQRDYANDTWQQPEIESALVFTVGQGFIPFFVAKQFRLQTVALLDRNLLALKTSEYNLENYRIQAQLYHAVFPAIDKKYDRIVGILPEKQNPEVYTVWLSTLQQILNEKGKIVLVSTSTVISRLQDEIRSKFQIVRSEKAKGFTALVLQKSFRTIKS